MQLSRRRLHRCFRGRRANALEAGFGVEQELPGGDHLLAFCQPLQDCGLAGVFRTQPHFHRSITTTVFGQHHQGTPTGTDDRFAGHPQGVLLRGATEADLSGHAGPQAAVGIGQFDPDAQRAALHIGLRQDGIDRARQYLTGEGGQPCLDRLALGNGSSVGLGHRHREPNAAQAVDTGQGVSGGDRHPSADVQLLQHPANGTGQRQHRLRLAAALHLADQRRRHAGQAQALARRCQQLRVARALECEKLLLGRRPLRNQQVDQWRIALEHIPWRPGMDPFDEAGATRLQHRHFPLVEGQDTAHFQADGQRSLADRRQTQAEVLAQAGVDADGGGVGPRAFVCVAGDQLHVHER
ncbi:hypothetical protein D3C85_1085270 [compost metagenome]